jgi:hypothetical protein
VFVRFLVGEISLIREASDAEEWRNADDQIPSWLT